MEIKLHKVVIPASAVDGPDEAGRRSACLTGQAGNLFTIYLVDFEIPDITSALLQ